MLDCPTSTVRSLVVEEHALPALVVTKTGHHDDYPGAIEFVDDEGAVTTPEGRDRGHLRVNHDHLDAFMKERNLRPRKGRSGELLATERDSLLKLVIGMAIDGYGFDPSAAKSPIPKQISDALQSRGLQLTDDTVRKWLKEAAETVLDRQPKPK